LPARGRSALVRFVTGAALLFAGDAVSFSVYGEWLMPLAGELLSGERLRANFADVPLPLADDEARVEAARCLSGVDAPCTRSCPA
jgi:hypothetical protein